MAFIRFALLRFAPLRFAPRRSARKRSALIDPWLCHVLVAPFSLSLAKSQPEKSEATSDNEGDPAHPHRYGPVSDGDGPLQENPHQVEQGHHGEDHPRHKR